MAPRQAAAVGLAAIFPVPKKKPPAVVPVMVHMLGCSPLQAILDKLLPIYRMYCVSSLSIPPICDKICDGNVHTYA